MLTLQPFIAPLIALSLLGWQDAAPKPAAGPAPAAAKPAVAQNSRLPATVQYRLASGLIVLDAAFGAGLPRPAALDTGLPALVIEAEAAKKLSLKAGDPRDVASPYGPLKLADLPPHTLRLGTLFLEGMPVSSAERMGVLSGRHPLETPDLWLGTPLFELLTVTIEPARSQLIFSAADAPLPPKAPAVPFEVKDGAITVSAKANGKASFTAVIDTCAFGLLLPTSVATELKLQPSAVVPVTLPDGKPGKVAEITLKELAIGPMKYKDVRALYVLEGSAGPIGTHGIIGTDLLLHNRVTFSFAQHKLAFEKPRPPEPEKAPKIKQPKTKPDTAKPAAGGTKAGAEKKSEPEKVTPPDTTSGAGS